MRRLLAHTAAALLMAGAMTTYGTARADNAGRDSSDSNQTDLSKLPTDLEGGLRLAQSFREAGKLPEAAQTLTQLLLFAPDDARVIGSYGKVMVLENRPQDAEAFLRRAVQMQGSDWTLYSALGIAYDEMGDHKSAKIAYERALTLKPGEPAILNNYAMSLLAAGDAASARRLMAQAQAADGKDATIAQNVSLVMSAARPVSAPAVKAAAAGPTPAKPAVEAPPVKAASVPAQPITPPPVLKPTAPARKIEVATLPKADMPVANATDGAAATGAPRVLNKDVVMQAVPVDPLAGSRRGSRTKHQAKAKEPTPSLRMSADAS